MLDEDRFRPGLFLSTTDFSKRLSFLSRKKFPVLPLDRAIELLRQGKLPPSATVITIDDGLYSTYCQAFRTLKQYGFPTTVYLTTYYFNKSMPVFNLLVYYMFWKTAKQRVDLTGFGIPYLTGEVILTRGTRAKDHYAAIIVEHGDTNCDEAGRYKLAQELGQRLEVDFREIEESRILNLINEMELEEMARAGIDFELHTHRHRFPFERDGAMREIADNRAVLEPLLKKRQEHFCYPSGIWSPAHWQVLADMGIKSATTTEPGLVGSGAPLYALKRITDSARVSQIEFEAEMYGYCELIRSLRRAIRGLTSRKGTGLDRVSPMHRRAL